MRRHLLISAVATLGIVLAAAESYAQVGSSCLRPLGIPDKWIEMQTPPWDPTDTFDPTRANPDLYYDGWIGFDPIEDQGRPMSLVLYDGSKPLQGLWAQLSATFTGPGSPISGLPIEFVHDGVVVATAETDGTGTARPETTAFLITAFPGDYPGAIRVRIRESSSFFVADEASADLTVLKKLPVITWLPPAEITYGTPLGPAQLNAVADVPGEFTYTPAAGAVLPVTHTEPATLAVTFVPAEQESELYDEATATTYITVVPAPLTVTVNDTSKLYLDPLPAFTLSAVGFVNGEDMSVLQVSPAWATVATASSDVGTYAIVPEWVDASNYAFTLKPGVLSIVPRPTAATMQPLTASPTTYGQTVSVTIAVSSGLGAPGGTVTLLSSGVPVATATLGSGQASISVSSLDAGSHALTAQYSGSGGFAGSSSPAVVHTVNPASTSTALTSSLNPSRAGQAVTFTATVSTSPPGGGAPAGSVEFLRNGNVMGAAPLTGGTAQLTISTLTSGKHAIQARYVGTGNHLPSASAVVQQTVKGSNK